MKGSKIRYIITISAVIIIVLHLVIPNMAIDEITLGLILIAIVPWLAPLFKSIEVPGVFKIEYQKMEKATALADEVGLLAPMKTMDNAPKYSFELTSDADPNLTLAGLRIEIEKSLRKIAESRNIPVQKQTVGGLMRLLKQDNALTNEEYGVLSDLIGLLNRAVHGAKVDNNAYDWALETGPRLLRSLDDIISRQ
jgi:hypothetical protein